VPPAGMWGGLMSGIEATVAITILVFFLGGITLGALAIVSAAIRREDRRFSLGQTAPDALTRSGRIVVRPATRGTRVWEQ
jgi:hypothetical protein